VILLGSVGSGKTTTARILTRFLRLRKSVASYYVDITVFHGLAYLIVATLSHIMQRLRGCRYVGNHYLTLWFNNRNLLRKIYPLSLFLDIFSLSLIATIRVYSKMFLCTFLRKKCVIFIDEGPITAIAIHYYFSKQFNTIMFLKYYYRVALALLSKLIESRNTLFVVLEQPLKHSIEAWFRREKTKMVDTNMILMRFAVEHVLLKSLSKLRRVRILKLGANNERYVTSEIMWTILTVSLDRTNL